MTSPTLSDVARVAGVSYATADRVINKRGNVADKSIFKVQQAMSSLGYVRNMAAANLSRGRVYKLAFLIPKGRNAFFNRIRQHIHHAADHLAKDRINVDVIEAAAFAVKGLQNSIHDLLDQHYDGVAIVGLKSPALEQPLANLTARGVAVVGLVSDLPQDHRAAYIGIDNTVAGRTAARMIGLSHGNTTGCVQTFAGSLDATDHAERLTGFNEVLRADFPKIEVLDPIMTKDDANVLQAATQTTLAARPDLSALYNVGAGNRGLITALRNLPAKRPFCVVHELVPDSRQALLDYHIDLVIDQRPEVEVNRAISTLCALIDDKDPPLMPDLVPTIYVRDNLPADPFTDPMKDKTP